MENCELGKLIEASVVEYAGLADRASRMSVRAKILGLIDRLELSANKEVRVRVVGEDELLAQASMRGAVILHLDFASRSTLTSSELLFTAASGKVLVAEHPDVPGFPIGICLLLPSDRLPKGRRQLFSARNQGWGATSKVISYALATNPGGLGAARKLTQTAIELSDGAEFVAYAPLTGFRARIIRLVDDPDAWEKVAATFSEKDAEALKRQLTDLLARDTLPDFVDQPAFEFLRADARAFAASSDYRVGEFHRHMGATLGELDHGGDPSESDSLWARVYLHYP